MAPAKTGNVKTNKNAVINIAHIKSGNLCQYINGILIFMTVVIQFMEPINDAAPDICKLNIAKSTAPPEWYEIVDSGGQTVQPVPAPVSTNIDRTNKKKAGGINQKLKLFNLGNAISGAPIIIGMNILPKPPIKAGITKKNNMIKP